MCVNNWFKVTNTPWNTRFGAENVAGQELSAIGMKTQAPITYPDTKHVNFTISRNNFVYHYTL